MTDDMKARLIGTWRLVSAVREEVVTGKTTDVFGAGATGYITYAADDRMMVLITGAGRKPAKSDTEHSRLQQTMLAYAGGYVLEPDLPLKTASPSVVHHIDVAWSPALVGQAQRRFVTFVGDRLILKGAEGPSAVDGVVARATITWERVGTWERAV